MISLPRYAIILVLSLGAGFLFRVHSQTTAPAKAPAASISGCVTIHGKGAPGIVVGVLTDFALRSLAPGQFNLQARFFAKYWYLRSIVRGVP